MNADDHMKSLKELLLEQTRVGDLWHPEPGDAVRCVACGHRCFIPENFDGVCKVRTNRGGELRVPFGYVSGLQVDPIEKKPFFHVLPGAQALSFGMLGCDFRCRYCQNWFSSQALRDPQASSQPMAMSVEEIITTAIGMKAKVLTSTYNEPLITSEWAVEIFKRGKASGLHTCYVSNGNGTPEVLEYIRPFTDYYKIDLKSFRDKRYRELGGVLANVKDTIVRVFEMGFWLEIVTLIIPDFNDDPSELKELCEFIAAVSPDIPWHATAFHSDYKMIATEDTGTQTLLRAAEIAGNAGLRYVYLGNRMGQVGNWENTYCHGCRALLVERRGFHILQNRVSMAGTCPDCQRVIPGRWSG